MKLCNIEYTFDGSISLETLSRKRIGIEMRNRDSTSRSDMLSHPYISYYHYFALRYQSFFLVTKPRIVCRLRKILYFSRVKGIFNVLLASAAMVIGFLSDERVNKPNRFPFGVVVFGMQRFFLLLYLVTRTSEMDAVVNANDNKESKESSSLLIGLLFSSVGSEAILWSFFGRPEYGSNTERFDSLIQLLSIDCVGCSFIVDLAIFSLFQGWLIDDDLRRRRLEREEKIDYWCPLVGKFIPFFGMAWYFWKRPELSNV